MILALLGQGGKQRQESREDALGPRAGKDRRAARTLPGRPPGLQHSRRKVEAENRFQKLSSHLHVGACTHTYTYKHIHIYIHTNNNKCLNKDSKISLRVKESSTHLKSQDLEAEAGALP